MCSSAQCNNSRCRSEAPDFASTYCSQAVAEGSGSKNEEEGGSTSTPITSNSFCRTTDAECVCTSCDGPTNSQFLYQYFFFLEGNEGISS